MTSDYKIGLDIASPAPTAIDTYFAALDDTEPRGDPMDYAETVTLANGGTRGLGYLNQTWHFDGISQAMRNSLFTNFANKSVLVRTRTNAGTFAWYTAMFVWPEREPEHYAGAVIDLTMTLVNLKASDYTES